MKDKSNPLYYPDCDQGSVETLHLPLDESSHMDEKVLLNEAKIKAVYPLYNCKCICSHCCSCGKVTKLRSDRSIEQRKCCKTCTICNCCKRINKTYVIFGFIFCAIGALICYIFMEQLMEDVIKSQLALKDGSERFNSWTRGEPPITYNIYVFNITNEKSFMKGARPRLKEVGPYVYEVHERKQDIKFENKDILTFTPNADFKFVPSLSTGSEDDIVTTLNVPLVNAGVEAKGRVVLENVIKIASKIHNFKSIQRLTVGELLWGHQSGILNWARKFKDIPYPYEMFGLMAGKNNTPQKNYTIFTGASDISETQQVILYDGKPNVGVWGPNSCDEIKGNLVGAFPPGIMKTETLQIFTGQLCRSLPLIYDKNVTNSGLDAYRFVPPPNTFSYGAANPSNNCFCQNKRCPPNGVYDVRSCYFGAAIAFSFPHFYQGDPTLRHVVRGLR